MELSSLHVCMDSPDWLQGTIHEETGMGSSSPSGDMLTCSRPPLMERRLRPPHDQSLKCPRCDSTHTKFCYYNNYSLSQPRYFCKTCRRYWTKGGTLRNIPVGGGCRKNKKVSSKKSSDDNKVVNLNHGPSSSSSNDNPINLQLSFPEVQFSHIANLLGTHLGGYGNLNFMDTKYNHMLENPTPIEFMDNKYEALVGASNGDMGIIGGVGDMTSSTLMAPNFHNFCTPFGMSYDGNHGAIIDNSQRLMLPYDHSHDVDQNGLDVKPNAKLLSLDWHDQGCSNLGKEQFGYLDGVGSWPGLMNGYGSSTTGHLV